MLSEKEINNEQDNNAILRVQDYVTEEDIIEKELYTDIEIKEVKFKNLDDNLVKDFVAEQNKIINNIKNKNITIDDINVYGGSKYMATTDVWYQINSDILTVYYKVNEMHYEGWLCPSNLITINIDLKNNKVLSNEETLKLVNYSFQDIAEKEYDKTLSNLDESIKLYVDVEKEITKEQFIEDKTYYINKIVSGLDEVTNVYIENGEVKYNVKEIGIASLYKYLPISGCFGYVTETVGRLE